MIDFSIPVSPPPVVTDIVLIYSGGDTPHVFTGAEIEAQPASCRLPCWVRSNPVNAVQAGSDAALFVAWLNEFKVPRGVSVVLDLETAVNAEYVDAFNLALRTAGYKVIKYGSLDYIFRNPKTDGGTFVADPTGIDHMVNEGDCVATQWKFAGSYDLSTVLGTVPLWEKPAFATPVPKSSIDLTISWPAIEGAIEYHYQVVNRNTSRVISDGHTNKTFIDLLELSPNVNFEYRVAVDATNELRASHWSDWVTVTYQ